MATNAVGICNQFPCNLCHCWHLGQTIFHENVFSGFMWVQRVWTETCIRGPTVLSIYIIVSGVFTQEQKENSNDDLNIGQIHHFHAYLNFSFRKLEYYGGEHVFERSILLTMGSGGICNSKTQVQIFKTSCKWLDSLYWQEAEKPTNITKKDTKYKSTTSYWMLGQSQ